MTSVPRRETGTSQDALGCDLSVRATEAAHDPHGIEAPLVARGEKGSPPSPLAGGGLPRLRSLLLGHDEETK